MNWGRFLKVLQPKALAEAEDEYKALVRRIEAAVEFQDEAAYTSLINDLNATIEEFNKIMHRKNSRHPINQISIRYLTNNILPKHGRILIYCFPKAKSPLGDLGKRNQTGVK